MREFNNLHGTRGGGGVFFSEAILNPSAENGGLYAPKIIPTIDRDFLERMLTSSYKDLAFNILKIFNITGDLGNNAIYNALHSYDTFDNPENPVPVKNPAKNIFVAELYHGPTRAFKDMALQPFPKLVSTLAQAKDKHFVILAATSGDTGPAALNGFRDLPNTKVVCLHPDGGTSHVQKEQMVKENGENLKVVGINGDFDDAQSALKKLIASKEFKKVLSEQGYELSAANSVNFGRIIFQIVYHFWSYLELVRQGEIELGEMITSIIPSGNFGNGLAAYYAKKMGLPIKKIVLASNENNVLTNFVQTGVYNLYNRSIIKTTSPAMDILKSSNVERLLYDLFGPDRTRELMSDLEGEHKCFTLTDDELETVQEIFGADYATDKEVQKQIRKCFMNNQYVIDPHTATAFVVQSKLYEDYEDYQHDHGYVDDKYIISSTAEWTKFSSVMAKAFDCEDNLEDIAAFLGQDLSPHIKNLDSMPVQHTDVIEVSNIESTILDFI